MVGLVVVVGVVGDVEARVEKDAIVARRN